MGSVFIKAPAKNLLDGDGKFIREIPDIDIVFENAVPILDLAKGDASKRVTWWHVNGALVDASALSGELLKADRDGFLRTDLQVDEIKEAIRFTHKFAGEPDL